MGEWIGAYGVWAVLAGGMLEGEAVFIAAGYAVSQGYIGRAGAAGRRDGCRPRRPSGGTWPPACGERGC